MMRLSQTQLSNSVSQNPGEERVSSESLETTKPVVIEDTYKNSPLRSAYLKRAIYKISSRSVQTSTTKNLSVQAQSTAGSQLKVGAQARPYLKMFLSGVEHDKNRK